MDPKAEVAQGGMPETGGLAGGGRAQVGSAAYLQNVENNRAMKVRFPCPVAVLTGLRLEL